MLERLTQRTQAEMKAKREHALSEISRMEQDAAERRHAQRDEMLRACVADVEANAATAVAVYSHLPGSGLNWARWSSAPGWLLQPDAITNPSLTERASIVAKPLPTDDCTAVAQR